MSISDIIVVMKDGVIQQTGKPQDVYDEPKNLFVAKFLGTPPINTFDGEVKNGSLYIGDEAVLTVSGVADGKVVAGIRPEGFIPKADGHFTCALSQVEVMGRDITVVAKHPAAHNPTVRAIVSSDNLSAINGEKVSFDLKENKVFLFAPDSGERLF